MAEFTAGQHVIVSGLRSEEYNDLTGDIIAPVNEHGRIAVRLTLSNGNRKQMALKPENLRLRNTEGRQRKAWQRAEEERVEASPPPPWYDEDLCPEYKDSMIFQEQYKSVLNRLELGEDADTLELRMEDIARTDSDGLRLLHMGALVADVPFMRALGRRGCDLNVISPSNGTPLSMVAGALLHMGDHIDPGRDEQTDIRTDGWTDGRMDRCWGGWMDAWIDR
eukprot:gene6455-7738_t